jgi:hypothetical protein
MARNYTAETCTLIFGLDNTVGGGWEVVEGVADVEWGADVEIDARAKARVRARA